MTNLFGQGKHRGLILTIGAPGSGKSTWGDKFLPPHTLRLERDRFREALFGSRQAYHTSPIAASTKSRVIESAMHAAMLHWDEDSYALTDTNLQLDKALPFINNARRWSENCTLLVFERSPEYLREMNRTRPEEHRVPDEVLESMINAFFDPGAWWRQPKWKRIWIKDEIPA